MIDREAVVDALRNCINKPKCQNCKWKECNEFHETFELPRGLVMDMYDLLKEQQDTELCDRCGRRRLITPRNIPLKW